MRLAEFLSLTAYDEVRIDTLSVGHTHINIDQVFSCIKRGVEGALAYAESFNAVWMNHWTFVHVRREVCGVL